MAVWPERVATGFPVPASHTLAVLSWLAVTTHFPSPLNAALFVGAVWRKVARAGAVSHLVSTKNNESDIFWGKKQGAAEYLPKPFTEQSLVAVVHKILGLAAPAGAMPASMPAPAQSHAPAPSGGGGKSQATIDAIQAAYMKAVGPFGKVAFKRELGNLGVPVELFGKNHAHTLVSTLAGSITDASARSTFEATCRQYT